MPKATLIAPWSDNEGKPHAAGEEVDMSDEEYQAGRAAGAVANVQEPYAGQEGHYGDMTHRPGQPQDPSVPVEQPEPLNQPAKDEDDEPDKPVKTPQQQHQQQANKKK